MALLQFILLFIGFIQLSFAQVEPKELDYWSTRVEINSGDFLELHYLIPSDSENTSSWKSLLNEFPFDSALILDSEKSKNNLTHQRNPAQELNPNERQQILNQLSDHKIPTDEHQLSQEQSTSFKKVLKESFDTKPSKENYQYGVLLGTYRGVTSSTIWFSSGVHPLAAAGIVSVQTMITFLHSTYSNQFNKFWGASFKTKNKTVSPLATFARRQAYGLMINEFIKFISQPSTFLTFNTQFGILMNMVISGTGSNLLSDAIDKSLKRSPLEQARMQFFSFLITAPLSMWDLASDANTYKIFEIAHTPIKWTSAILFFTYLGLTKVIQSKPQWILPPANWIGKNVETLLGGASSKVIRFKKRIVHHCKEALLSVKSAFLLP